MLLAVDASCGYLVRVLNANDFDSFACPPSHRSWTSSPVRTQLHEDGYLRWEVSSVPRRYTTRTCTDGDRKDVKMHRDPKVSYPLAFVIRMNMLGDKNMHSLTSSTKYVCFPLHYACCLDLYLRLTLFLRQLFYWIWPRVVQDELDVYREYWNIHTIRPQKQKVMPSGDSPNQFWTEPEEYNGQRLTIPVPNIAVRAMRADLPKTREEVMTWPTTLEFDTVAQDAYETLGSPKITKENGWALFRRMMPLIRASLGQT